jgi:hypothetical protein
VSNPSLAGADATAGELESMLSAAQEAAFALRDSAALTHGHNVVKIFILSTVCCDVAREPVP